ncbi:5-oxoprolinase subunit PxpB [Pedobacter duraquae]|uniref:Inhibitor of KinA n=1 Tax=Pedobacter duraquae TaxID=425511 RepID=A0A4R6IGV3_9SPHI|nr:5-oxoprolinase subunit PxpB [Pedobacter duraquae]TDO20205.1 inhibitor of KinA [Pedobacter duraquae]
MTNLFIDIYALNEGAVTVVFGEEINLILAGKIRRFNETISRYPFPGMITTVAAYTSLTVFYDPVTLFGAGLPGLSNFDKITHYLKNLAIETNLDEVMPTKIVVPVCYGGTMGPDLDLVATAKKLTSAEIIEFHSSATYYVHMIGFVPGFAYLGGMNPELNMPRKTQPRAIVKAGSVGIAGAQTGIYSLDTPGGWQIIGRTPLRMFDAERQQPSLLQSGYEVVFKPVTMKEFEYLKAHNDEN